MKRQPFKNYFVEAVESYKLGTHRQTLANIRVNTATHPLKSITFNNISEVVRAQALGIYP